MIKTKFTKLLGSNLNKHALDKYNPISYDFDIALRKQGWPYAWNSNNKQFLNITYLVKNKNFGFDIFPIDDDDWYLVIFFYKKEWEYEYEYYKCDQYEGVVQLLKDKGCPIGYKPKPNFIKKISNYFK